ncbi:hypothetical protein BE04_13435 [Sorangium cellulosum]|uniref:Uncharacterized protein n=1 Tax=Sorangium cellulosum TaxID=56 RepID=A0A150P0E2_SORCE|nr:hypothetical protein BE04_13435 [Sorangium cellulosum]
MGPALEIEGGVLPRDGLVPIGAFSRGLYFMASEGAILADEAWWSASSSRIRGASFWSGSPWNHPELSIERSEAAR